MSSQSPQSIPSESRDGWALLLQQHFLGGAPLRLGGSQLGEDDMLLGVLGVAASLSATT